MSTVTPRREDTFEASSSSRELFCLSSALERRQQFDHSPSLQPPILSRWLSEMEVVSERRCLPFSFECFGHCANISTEGRVRGLGDGERSVEADCGSKGRGAVTLSETEVGALSATCKSTSTGQLRLAVSGPETGHSSPLAFILSSTLG